MKILLSFSSLRVPTFAPIIRQLPYGLGLIPDYIKTMEKKNYYEVEVTVGNETRKVAFAKGINREVNFANVKKLLADMEDKGYRKAEMVQVVHAEEITDKGDIVLVDINGNEITNDNAGQFFLIIDGQHRVYAASLLNIKHERQKRPIIKVPGTLVELAEGETVAEYISAVNITKMPWKTDDYVRGAANVKKNALLEKYNELIRTNDNPNGFPLSTLNIIYCNNPKAINKTALSLLCQGKDTNGKSKKDIIPAHSIERGNRFIATCKEKGFTDKDISKRYLAERFSSYFNEGSEEKAFRIFNEITPNDCKSMHNDKGNLVEDKVIEQFRLIEGRIA